MRIVLLGNRVAGRSSTGNTILGRTVFNTSSRTAECVKREGQTAGRHITVVEAPGWWYDSTVEQTPERDRREIVLSVSLCPPGPHALLLVIDVSRPFTMKHKRAMQQHLELLGATVWNHSIVLFSRGDCLGEKNTEQHIESGGEALQWVVEKCGNRYHVVNNRNRDGGQVTELLEKIEEMVAGNRGHHFDFDVEMIHKLKENKEEEKRRAEERKIKVQERREFLKSSAAGIPHVSDLKILLLGNRAAGKSSSGNTILGRSTFDTSRRTAECVKREGETAGRHITVVEAPGWWCTCTAQLTPHHDKQEIALSVSLCPPGPHALLLVINLSQSFTDAYRRGVQEHLELLGKRVWSHTMVLFTRGLWLGDASIEQHIESGGEALQWVVEKCGNRYHVVDNRNSDVGQVAKLLEKIEEMVAGNSGHHFDFNVMMMKELMGKKKEEKRRAEKRKMKVQRERERLRASAGGIPHISDLRIILLGIRQTGKSSLGNTILGREEFGTSGRTAECVKREGKTERRHITVVEVPGWWKNFTVEETSSCDKQEIVLSVSLCPPGPHALLLVINVSRSFTEIHRKAVQGHVELLGETVWKHIIVLFTYGDCLGETTIEQHIESGGEALQWVVEKCGNRYHVVEKMNSDVGQVTELLEKIEEMVAGNSGRHFQFEAEIVKQWIEKRQEEERRAEERKMKVQKQRETLRSSAGGIPHISDMRIVLLGGRAAGKSSLGNTILGREEFNTLGRTAECVKRKGETAGRHITVVEAPGWWKNYSLNQTTERDKREIVLSVSLCPPGPHALILVIDVTFKFTETYRRAVQQHMELLGEKVWSHTIVLFTSGDWPNDTSIEQHIESERTGLRWVVEKCGNRYHVVNKKRSNGSQVMELLQKIDEMVTGNGGNHFDFDAKLMRKLLEKKEEEERRAEERKRKQEKQRETPGSLAGGVPHISDMRIVLLGGTSAGKSSSGNTILGREEFDTTGGTAACVKRERETAGRHITVVEAPGWWNGNSIEQTADRNKPEIVLSVSLCPPGPHALLLVINVSKKFTETHRTAVQEHMELLGERVWSHTIVLFTRGEWLGDSCIEQHIESGGEALQWVVEKCGNRYHVVDNKKRDGGQVTELLEKIEEMVARSAGDWSMNSPPKFGEGLRDDISREDSAYGSVQSAESSEFGSGKTGETSGSAGESLPMIPQTGTDGGGESKGATDREQKTPLTPTRGKVWKERRAFHVTVHFVEKITVNETAIIGQGSFGKVYKGSFQGTPAAVKIIPIGDDPGTSNEFTIPRHLSHPNIVRMMAVERNETQILIANEFIHGANLAEVLYTETSIKLELEDKLFVALDIAMAVEYIHGKNIIHQDLKPANIMIAADNKKAYLTDWGFANLKESVSMMRGSSQTGAHCGLLGGTPAYMARECLIECGKCSTMSDMWSLGITLLEMFTNSKPWSDRALQELHKLPKLHSDLYDIVKPLIDHQPESRMSANNLVILLKSKVDVSKRYGYKW